MVPFESLGTVSYSHFLVTMALFCIVSGIKRDIVENRDFFHTPPAAFDAPLGDHCRNIAIRFGTEKLE